MLARVTNRITYTLPAGAPSAAVLGATEVHGPEVAVNRRPAIVIKHSPLEGKGWLATTACCGPNPHRDLRLAVDGGRIETAETFAVDWGLVKGDRLFAGDGSTNEQFYGFGADVLAVADGTVVFTQDGVPEQSPSAVIPADKQADIGGNKVILKIGPRVFAVYEHLQPGGLTVKVDDVVKAGALLAKLGNTGPSTGPHLHFGLLDRPDIFTGRALPFVFARYTLAGTVTSQPQKVTPWCQAGVAAGSFGLSALGEHPELRPPPAQRSCSSPCESGNSSKRGLVAIESVGVVDGRGRCNTVDLTGTSARRGSASTFTGTRTAATFHA